MVNPENSNYEYDGRERYLTGAPFFQAINEFQSVRSRSFDALA